ncbi:MAG: hypothetical protein M2R45_03300 [Verrucomicrobia subdivision 3 bacterium]|nr:hypothetical protein [Limisphaerales bacterium]MCS1415422.1 hypothetical protein [Limisphaerales bacterium]
MKTHWPIPRFSLTTLALLLNVSCGQSEPETKVTTYEETIPDTTETTGKILLLGSKQLQSSRKIAR